MADDDKKRSPAELDRDIARWTAEIAKNPQNAAAYNNRGIAHAKKGDYDLAIADYNKAIELKPDYAKAYSNRGVAYDEKGDHDSAIADYNKAIELKPDYAIAYNKRGVAYGKRGDISLDVSDYNLAIADFNKAIELKPDYAEAYNARGVAYRKNGDVDSAIADYDKAIELKPDFVKAYNNRGVAHGKKGDYDSEIADYNKAIELKPDHVNAHHNRAIALARKEAEATREKFEEEHKKQLEFVTNPTEIARKFKEREKEYIDEEEGLKDEYDEILKRMKASIEKNAVSFIGFIIVVCGLSAWGGTAWNIPFIIASSTLAASAFYLPDFLRMNFIKRQIRVLQVCKEDYFRKQVLLSHTLSAGEDKELRRELVAKSHAHFSDKSAAEFLAGMDDKTKASDSHPAASFLRAAGKQKDGDGKE